MKYEKIFVEHPRIGYNFFTRKYAETLLKFINNTRLGADMRFEGFGKISFADDLQQIINVDICLDEFKNRNVQALVFDINCSPRNSEGFDKIIMFTQTVDKSNYIHYVLFDKVTGHTITHYYRDADYTEILKDLNVCFSRLTNSSKIRKYIELGKNCNRHPKDVDLHIITNGLYGV